MAYPCPSCGDRYTQSLPMVYGTSTSVRQWRSSSGYRGATTSQTLVGEIATPPVKRSMLWPLLWLFVLSGVFTVMQGFVRDQQGWNAQARVRAMGRRAPARHRGGAMWMPPVTHESAFTDAQWEQIAAGIGVVWVGMGILLVGLAARVVWFNTRVYPVEFARWSQSYMCRGCGVVFAAPGSGMVAPGRRP